MNSIARIIITQTCYRNCTYCINQYDSVIEQGIVIPDIDNLPLYSTYIISGGEPLMAPKLDAVLDELQSRSGSRVYFHTTLYKWNLFSTLDRTNGLTFTLHDDMSAEEIDRFNRLQNRLKSYERNDKTLFLNIGANFKRLECIQWKLWDQTKRMRWLSGNDFKMTFEDLYILGN